MMIPKIKGNTLFHSQPQSGKAIYTLHNMSTHLSSIIRSLTAQLTRHSLAYVKKDTSNEREK